MEQAHIEQLLMDIGLTQYESRIYVTLMRIGESKVAQILKHAQLHHIGRIYDILESLEKKHLITKTIENKVKVYQVTDPQQIYEYVEQKKNMLIEKQTSFLEVLPYLRKQANALKREPLIEVYTGFEGLKNAHRKEIDRLSTASMLYVWGPDIDSYPPVASGYMKHTLEPLRKDIKSQRLYCKKNKDTYGTTKYLAMQTTHSTTVIGDLVVLTYVQEQLTTITIESTSIAQGYLAQFKQLWKCAQ
ncbi:MAG: TrmB family transcriptional regulator [Candidatus Woesearchaeota archaeon]